MARGGGGNGRGGPRVSGSLIVPFRLREVIDLTGFGKEMENFAKCFFFILLLSTRCLVISRYIFGQWNFYVSNWICDFDKRNNNSTVYL